MAAPPDHARAPEVERAALKDATEQFARLLDAAIRKGRERDVAPAAPELAGTERPLPFRRPAAFDAPERRVNGVTMKEYCRAWRDQRRQARRAMERRAQQEQLALLAPNRARGRRSASSPSWTSPTTPAASRSATARSCSAAPRRCRGNRIARAACAASTGGRATKTRCRVCKGASRVMS
jgi:hypothetical protein